jgi:hypothetical protein
MVEEEPWSDFERLVLIRCTRDMLPMMADVMNRPLNHVVEKFLQLHEIFERQYEEEAKKYMSLGFMRDEAYEKVADEVDIDFEKIRAIEK